MPGSVGPRPGEMGASRQGDLLSRSSNTLIAVDVNGQGSTLAVGIACVGATAYRRFVPGESAPRRSGDSRQRRPTGRMPSVEGCGMVLASATAATSSSNVIR